MTGCMTRARVRPEAVRHQRGRGESEAEGTAREDRWARALKATSSFHSNIFLHKPDKPKLGSSVGNHSCLGSKL